MWFCKPAGTEPVNQQINLEYLPFLARSKYDDKTKHSLLETVNYKDFAT